MKLKPKQVIQAIKEQEKASKKTNITFRLSVNLMNTLRKKCETEDVSMNAVVEKLLTDFLE